MLQKEWNEFYGTELTDPNYYSATHCQLDDCVNKSQLTLSGNAWIAKCYFHDMSSTNGGAIYSDSLSKLLVEASTFDSCSVSSEGGAIYISSGDFVLHEVCGYQCTSSDYYSFSEVWQSSGTKDKLCTRFINCILCC